jgi:hypothetical protein
MKNNLFALAMALVLVACGPATRIEKSWKEPGATKKMTDYQKVLVVCFAQSESARRHAEDDIVRGMGGRGVASYSYSVMADKANSKDAITAAIKKDGFDAAIVTRLIDKEKETSYVPGTVTYPYYRNFWGYYGWGYGAYTTPGYYVENHVYYVETNVYDLEKDQLVWSAVTATTNPGKLDKAVNEIAGVIKRQMRVDGF